MKASEHKIGRFERLRALIVKEGLQIVRDPSSILISVVLPIFLLILYGYGVSLDLNHLRLGIVLEDTSPEARELADSFLFSRYFDVTLVQDRRELIDPITAGAIRGFVVVPAYFSQFQKRGKIAPIQVIGDGSEPNTANFVQFYAAGAYQKWLEQQRLLGKREASVNTGLAVLAPRMWYNEQLESRYFLLSGSLAIIMTLIGTLLTALVVAREWERGTMEALMSTRVSIGELVLGKLIPYFALGMISMLICIVVSITIFGLPLRGSFLVLILVSAIFLFGATGLGLMISTIARNQVVAYQISIVTGFLPAYILSGFLFEIASMPLPIQWLTYILPARYFVQALQTLFLVGNVWPLIIRNIIPMLAIGIIFYLITASKTVKRLD